MENIRNKRSLKNLIIACLLASTLVSCELIIPAADIEISNNSGWDADMYYRKSGTVEWIFLETISDAEMKNFKFVGGLFDFRFKDHQSNGEQEYDIIITRKDLSTDSSYSLIITHYFTITFLEV